MTKINPLISPQARGDIRPPKNDSGNLRLQGRLKSRLVRLIHKLKPGGSNRVRRTNQAIRQFIARRLGQDGVGSSEIQAAMNRYTQPNKPITARQVTQITNALADTTPAEGSKAVFQDQPTDGFTLRPNRPVRRGLSPEEIAIRASRSVKAGNASGLSAAGKS